MGVRGELYSTKAFSEKRTYFFNVKENRLGTYFMNIVESKKEDEADFRRSQIMVYEEDIEEFMKELQKAVLFLKKAKEVSGQSKSSGVSDRGQDD